VAAAWRRDGVNLAALDFVKQALVTDIKILIVDDESRNLDSLEVMLAPVECTLVRAQSADEALLAMLKHEFAAMILDIKMPGMSGIELAHLVKQRRRTQDVPILFMTAHLVEDEDVLRGYGVGAVDYLSKPINADILRSKVGVFVDVYRKSRALAQLNEDLQEQIVQREQAQAALEQVNQELELRVAERTAELTVAHRGVRENEERLRMAMDVAQIAAWEWDVASGRVTWSTDPETLFNFPSGAFGPDLRISVVRHPDDAARVDEAVRAAMTSSGGVASAGSAGSADCAGVAVGAGGQGSQNGGPHPGHYECEYRAVRPDGVVVWLTERGRVLQGPTGEVEKIVGVTRDVSAQRRAELERERLLVSERRARDEAERQGRIKDEFLATLSHELRTPMNAILGWLNMLTTGKGLRNPEKAIAVIERNAQLQARLIEDLLEMNKLTSGTVRLEISPLDLVATLDAAMESLKPAAETKDVRLTVEMPAAMPRIPADARRVQQILWNVLHNAVKFTRPGGQVAVRAAADEGWVRIQVADTGQGIPADFLPYVFDRFRQADSSSTREAWGLGIGLSIAKHLVELHGGSIEASSAGLNQGATFIVQLPVTRQPGASDPAAGLGGLDAAPVGDRQPVI
jgi:signal transduction histidine kinase/DNA-binding response OmpR family regulator